LVGGFNGKSRIEPIKIDPNANDPTLMRSLMYFPNADCCFYGSEALVQFTHHEMEGRLFRSFKSHLPNKNYIGPVIDNRILSLENLIGTFLLELKKRAENSLNIKFEHAVIGRPARYSMDDVSHEFALWRMRKAAEFAGFKEIKFVPEPTAAALEFKREISDEKIVLIGDFGGGTSDFTIMKMSPHKFQKSDVLSVDGCPMAGDALDSLFMQLRLNIGFGAKTKYQFPMSGNVLTMPQAVMERLNKPAHIVHLKERETYEFIKEVRKCALTMADKKNIDRLFILIEDQQIFPFFDEIEKTKKNLSFENAAKFNFEYPDLETSELFTENEFSDWAKTTKTEIFSALDRCLKSAGLNYSQIDQIFMTGGTAHVPFIKNEFVARFGNEKMQSKNMFHSIISGLIESAADWENLEN
jgi:hypothetical chaperone protein